MTVSRLQYLDSIKGILIVLVVIGHAIQYCLPNYEQNFCFRLIYSFHMPLFFFVSGYLSNRFIFNSSVIPKRAYQLLIPFTIWAFLSPLLQTGNMNIYKGLQIIIYPNNGLWFLYNLFIYSAIFNIAEYVEQKTKYKHCIIVGFFILLLYCMMFLFHTKFNCTQLCYHILFYGLGYYYKQLDFRLNNINNNYIYLLGGYLHYQFLFGQQMEFLYFINILI